MSRQTDTDPGTFVTPMVVEAIAQRVAELLRAELDLAARLLTPSEVADRFAVSRTWVYEHADELGAIRLGQGPKARLRFDIERVQRALSRAPREDAPPDESRGRRRMKKGLLPIGSE
jgi:hypothetical protein